MSYFTALDTDQDLPIFQFAKDDITRREFNTQTNKMEVNEKAYKDNKSSLDDFEPLLNSLRSFEKINFVTTNCPELLDEETAVNIAIKHDKGNEGKGDKDNEDGDYDEDDTGLVPEEHKDHKNTANVGTHLDMAVIMDAVQKLSRETNERKRITFLDFAGQSIYYAFHQIYLSPETFSILVVDMTKDPQHICEADDNRYGRFKSWTYKGNKILTTTYMYT